MKVAIMQPYFLPYIGYWQLMNLVDEFIVYDNIQYTKKGWINRNRILVNGKDEFISIPLKSDSDFLDVRDRILADSWDLNQSKLLNKISESYRKAPQFKIVFPFLQKIFSFNTKNLFEFIFNSISEIKNLLEINTKLVVSSTVLANHTLKAEKKVIALCKSQGANFYLNPIGGLELYNKEEFKAEGIDLQFLKSNNFIYQQFENEFVPWLSILDVLMFVPVNRIKKYLDGEFTFI